VRSRFALMLFGLTLCASAARAQSSSDWEPQHGAREIEVWSSAGHSAAGGTSNTGLWDMGLSYGWVLTDAKGPGFLRGNFEYMLDAVPVYLIFQPSGVVYGAGFNPLGLKWNFQARGRFAPYFELSGGTLFSSSEVPGGANHLNFASGPALGINVQRGKFHWSAEMRLTHISDAGLTSSNPGINVLQVRVGLGRFRRRRG
jgi:hypothetical protein